jgi:hypothetical protein
VGVVRLLNAELNSFPAGCLTKSCGEKEFWRIECDESKRSRTWSGEDERRAIEEIDQKANNSYGWCFRW